MTEGRWAWAEVDLAAVRHNVEVLRTTVEPAEVWAVVKADGYGHGAVQVGKAALEAGAAGLCVALVQEGVALRAAGIDAPVLLLSQQPDDQVAEAVRRGLTLTVYTTRGVDAAARAGAPGVHIKVDTGMHRVGAEPSNVAHLADRAVAAGLRLDGVFTHLAVADEPDREASAEQLCRLDEVVAELAECGHRPARVHAANSAGALAHPGARRDMVRAGIAIYGLQPGPAIAHLCASLRPVLALKSRVSMVKRVAGGAGVSYGLRYFATGPRTIATVPIGYADGVPRRLWERGGAVLIGGRRRPITGVVTMDQLMVDCGDDAVAVGDEVVVIGRQGGEAITADEVADLTGTIGYEIVCGISARVPRVYRSSGAAAG